MSQDLLYSLGLDITDFKTSAQAADEQAKSIKRGLGDLKTVITAGGVGTAVIGFFRSVVQQAMEAKGVMDENTAAVQRFGRAWADTGTVSRSWGAQVLGTINRIGEGFGLLARMQIEGGQGFFGRLLNGDLSGALGAYGKAVADVRREHARDVELSKQEAILAQEKLKHATEDKRLREEAARITQQENAWALKNLTAQERVNQLANEYTAIERQLAAFQGTALERRAKENELRTAGLALLNAQDTLLKEQADNEKKAADAARDAARDKERTLDEQAKKNEQIAALRLKGVDQLNEAEKLQLELLEGRITKRQIEAEIALLLARGVENLTEEEKRRLGVLSNVTPVIKGQTEELEKQKKIMQQIAAFASAMAGRGGAQLNDADSDALKELLRRNRETILEQQARIPLASEAGRLYAQSDIGRLQRENQNIQRELAFRRQFERDVQLGGEDRARRNFGGDPLAFDEVFSRLTGQFEKQDETNDLLERLNRKLDAGIEVRPIGG